MRANVIKRAILLLLAASLLIAIPSCGRDSLPPTETEQTSETSDTETQAPSSDGDNDEKDDDVEQILKNTKIMLNKSVPSLKLLDERMTVTNVGTVCDWTCAGIEFIAECEGDVSLGVLLDHGSGCYFRAFVDGKAWKNGDSDYYICTSEASEITLKGIPRGTHTVRLVKVTGYTLARTTLTHLSLRGTLSQSAPADKPLYIGYIGDSMFCGYGVIGSYDGKYYSQDGTLAIPYMVSEKLNADYSVVALSGQGAAIGNPNVEVGYKYASALRSTTDEFSFERKSDIVIINIGTNDFSNPDVSTPALFRAAYKRILEYVRAKNGDNCKILALYNIMNDTYASEILSVIDELGGADEGYYTLKLNRTAKVYTSHPTKEENAAYTDIICPVVSSILDGSYSNGTVGRSDLFIYEQNEITGDRLTVVEDKGFGGEVNRAN